MSSKLSYIGSITDGKLILTASVRKQMLADLGKYEGKRVEVEIKKLPRRSNAQNAYYWGVVVSLVTQRLKFLGHDVSNDDTHCYLKDKFNGKDIASIDGEFIGKIGGNTTKMNKPEFMDYIAAIQQFSAQYLGLDIPNPNEQTEFEFETEQAA